MEAVGYDMYCRLLGEAIDEIKGVEKPKEVEVSIDIKISAYIAGDYIESESQRIVVYKKIASIESEEDAFDIRDEIIDRYGSMPKETENLIQVAVIKALAKKCGVAAIKQKYGKPVLKFQEDLAKPDPEKLPNIKFLLQLVNKLQQQS